jgi:hypothetical protein
MLLGQPLLEGGDAGYFTADKCLVIDYRLRLDRVDHTSAMGGKFVDGWDILHWQHRAAREFEGARPEHVRMGVEWDLEAAVTVADKVQCPQDGAAVVPMAVRQNNCFDGREIGIETRHVLFESSVLRSRVEKNGALPCPAMRCDETGETVRGATQAPACEDPLTTPSPRQSGDFSLDEGRGRGKVICQVVDQNMYLNLINGIECEHAVSPEAKSEAYKVGSIGTMFNAELGYKDYEVENWFGVLAPAKKPKETIIQLIA